MIPKHPILTYFLNILIARGAIGDTLHDATPMFALPLNRNNDVNFLPLTYSDILKADTIQTEALGSIDLPIRTHLKRK